MGNIKRVVCIRGVLLTLARLGVLVTRIAVTRREVREWELNKDNCLTVLFSRSRLAPKFEILGYPLFELLELDTYGR